MKKTLMVLTFALCASFVFAQMATPRMKSEYKAPAQAAQIQNNNQNFVFTKDATVLFSCDFSAANTGYSTGVINGGLEGHAENYDFATWHRWPNADSSTFLTAAATYAALAQNYFGGVENFCSGMMGYLDTSVTSAENGFMMMSLYDQRTPFSGNFNAYILFSGIDASEAHVVDVSFYQFYRKYYDNCYLDYCTSGNNFNEMEINTTGIDIDVNGQIVGMVTYTLPIAAAGSSNLSVRIRYKSLDAARNAYGYFWAIDDVTMVCGPDNRLQKYDQEYVEGNYAMVPQGMKINPAWFSQVKNSGAVDQNNVNAKIYHLNATQDQATEIDAFNNGTVGVSATKGIYVDREGWLGVDSLDYRGWYGYIDHTPHGSGVDLPTETLGDNYIYATAGNDSVTVAYDTMWYQVMGANNGKYTWSHDNGVLTYSPYNYWLFGYVNVNGTWYVTEDAEDVHFYQAGYMVNSRYTTDNTVPAGWVIKGVELVASPVDGYHSTGSKISAVLMQDQYDGGSVGFNTVVTGANVKEITSADVNDSNVIGRNSAGYLTNGNYHTVYIEFPEQPALEPNTSYRVGYSMEEDGYFALAQEAQGSYRVASPTRPDRYDTIIYFKNDEATAKYASRFPVNQYQTYIYDPSYGGDGNGSTFASWYVPYNPMIRLIVGEETAVTRHNINVTCEGEDYGYAAYAGNAVCGQTVTPVAGSTATIVGYSLTGCLATVTVDGVVVEPFNEDTEEGDPNFTISYDESQESYAYFYSFALIEGDHTIHFEFFEDTTQISIDPVAAGVRMNLQPNPATSQVNLNIAGVTGMVNCMLIDMSGRVVYNQNINAESAQVINLSNLAKGAYFVRITNDKFSKVEKLIVR